MIASILAILASALQLVRGLFGWLGRRREQQIGKNEAALNALLREKEDAKHQAKRKTEIGRLNSADLDKRLDRWMRD